MFILCLLIGIYSYSIFLLGLTGILHKNIVFWFTILYWATFVLVKIRGVKWGRRIRVFNNKLLLFIISLFALQALVNLIGVLGPEKSFDALWYHLTLPKLYLQNHIIYFIPGGLLYYSAMPKLTEMLYVGGLTIGNEIIPKFIHFCFGLLACIAIFKLSRKIFNKFISFLAVIIFYSNLVVGWESVAAYVDLTRTFFEIMALWAFINWSESRKQEWLIWAAILTGFAITTKLLAIGSLFIFIALIILDSFRKKRKILWFKDCIIFIFISLAIPLPWFIFSYINTGNPIYPFFSEIYKVVLEPINLISFVKDVWVLFTHAADPLSIVYVVFFPFMVFLWKRPIKDERIKIIGVYFLLAVIIWYFTPRSGGGRFILPYLPALSILSVWVYSEINKRHKYLGRLLLTIICIAALFSLTYRFAANIKYLPVIFGSETKAKFLTKNLNYSFGDFYDIDGYFKNHIKSEDTVLLYGFHNLYYINFPFIDFTWLKEGDRFNYIAVQNSTLPEKYKNWKLVYENNKTMVKLYKRL